MLRLILIASLCLPTSFACSAERALRLERVASGLTLPLWVTAPPGDTSRLFVVEQRQDGTGRIKIISLATNTVQSPPFLEVEGVTRSYEEGLLGLAFHPDYAENGRFFVYYTTVDASVNPIAPHHVSRLEEYSVSAADPNRADPDSAKMVLTFPQPAKNHNGGWLAFDSAGYLFLSTGDGGHSENPGLPAQMLMDDPTTPDKNEGLLGKLLRLDVNRDAFPDDPNRNYAIPPDNPFVGTEKAPEVWAYGLRNPWRASIDRKTGDIWIGDVGEVSWEEIDFLPASSGGGQNFGWRPREGSHDNRHVSDPAPVPRVDPVLDYGRDEGMSVTGGYVYRGSEIPWLRGTYFYADYAMGWIRSFRYDGKSISDRRDWTDMLEASLPDERNLRNISSFGEDAAGELYIVDLGGSIYRIADASGGQTD